MKYKNKVHVKNVGKHSNIVFRAVVLQDIEHFRKSAYQVVKKLSASSSLEIWKFIF